MRKLGWTINQPARRPRHPPSAPVGEASQPILQVAGRHHRRPGRVANLDLISTNGLAGFAL